MGAMRFIAAFAVAWICVIGGIAVSVLLTILTAPLLKRSRALHVASHFVYDFLGASVSVYIAVSVCSLMGADITWLMILLPGLFVLNRNLKRVQGALAGDSEVSRLWKRHGLVRYSCTLEVLMEIGRLTGASLGLVVGMLLFAKNAAFW